MRTLRFYEERGLIRPAHVDDASGYRYYTLDQLPRLNRVLALRDLGLSLDDIARLVNKPLSPERLRVLLCEKQRELAVRVEEERARLRRVEARLRQIESEGTMPDYEVIVKRVEPMLVASVRDTIPDWDQVNATFNRLFDEVQSHVARHNGKCAGAPLDLWHDPAMSGQDMAVEAAWPLAQPIPESDRVKVYLLPGVETMASTTHHGPFATFPDAYHALLRWIESNGYRVAGPNREIYLQYERDGDPNKSGYRCPTPARLGFRHNGACHSISHPGYGPYCVVAGKARSLSNFRITSMRTKPKAGKSARREQRTSLHSPHPSSW